MNRCNRPRTRLGLRFGAAALALCTLAAPGIAQTENVAQTEKPVFAPLDVFDLQWASDPQISPDGRSIAYVRMSFDIKTDRPRGTIWLIGADGKHARPLTGAAPSTKPRWSPDGTRLAYLGAGADGSTQLFVYWTDSGATAAISGWALPCRSPPSASP